MSYEYPAEVIQAATEKRRQFNDALSDLVRKWYTIAANEAVFEGTQHGYRECADQLKDLLAEHLEPSVPDYGKIDDGFGNVWHLCKPDCRLEIVRPGKVQCECDSV